MPGYLTRRERQGKQESLVHCLSGPLRQYLPDSWIESAGGLATRFAAFPPSGHGVVYASASALFRPVLPCHAKLVAIRQDKRGFVAAVGPIQAHTARPGSGYPILSSPVLPREWERC